MKKQNAKDRILNTASKLFTERGYASVGINEIIKESGTAKATFYSNFPSKENLCATWLKETHIRSESFHDEFLEKPGDPIEKVREYFISLKDWMQDNQFSGCPYSNTVANDTGNTPAIQEQVTVHKTFQRDFFRDLVRAFCTPSEARQLGTALYIMYSGATTESRNHQATWPIEDTATAAVRLCESYANKIVT